MEQKSKFSSPTGFSRKLLVASLFILSGILLFAHNMGWITTELFSMVVSWYSLFIITGIYPVIHHHFVNGIILVLIGVYFLLGDLSWLPESSQATVWPLTLITTGVLFLFKSGHRGSWSDKQRMFRDHGEWMKHGHYSHADMNFASNQQQSGSEDGFLCSDNASGATRHVVLDEFFKGAVVRTSCGGTTIDLRHIHIAPEETYIDLDCGWGGIEIHIPSDQKVVFKCSAFFDDCDDKHWQNGNINKESVLIIRGRLSFGGLEVKD